MLAAPATFLSGIALCFSDQGRCGCNPLGAGGEETAEPAYPGVEGGGCIFRWFLWCLVIQQGNSGGFQTGSWGILGGRIHSSPARLSTVESNLDGAPWVVFKIKSLFKSK